MPFEPGNNANPVGRPKGTTAMAKEIRRRTGYGDELIDFFWRIFTGEEKGMKAPKYRMEAARWLTDRGFGKAVQSLDIAINAGNEGPDATDIDFQACSAEQLEALEKAFAILNDPRLPRHGGKQARIINILPPAFSEKK